MLLSKEMLISFLGGCGIAFTGDAIGAPFWLYGPMAFGWGFYMGRVWSARQLREWRERHDT